MYSLQKANCPSCVLQVNQVEQVIPAKKHHGALPMGSFGFKRIFTEGKYYMSKPLRLTLSKMKSKDHEAIDDGQDSYVSLIRYEQISFF